MSDEVLSGSEFLEVLCDQALRSRATKGSGLDWEWSSEQEKMVAMRVDGYWLFALTSVFVNVLFTEAPRGSVVLYGDRMQREQFGNRVQERLSLYQPWFITWAVHHASMALRHSPRFHGEMFVGMGGATFCIARNDSEDYGVVSISLARPYPK